MNILIGVRPPPPPPQSGDAKVQKGQKFCGLLKCKFKIRGYILRGTGETKKFSQELSAKNDSP